MFFFFKQKTAYEMRISDWSSDVCSSDLVDDMRGILQRLDRIAPIGCEFGAARQQSLTLVDVERREARRAAGRLARIGIAVEQFDPSFGTGDRKSTRLNSNPYCATRMPSSASKKKKNHDANPHEPQ